MVEKRYGAFIIEWDRDIEEYVSVGCYVEAPEYDVDGWDSLEELQAWLKDNPDVEDMCVVDEISGASEHVYGGIMPDGHSELHKHQ